MRNAMAGSMVVAGVGRLVIPLASGPTELAVALLVTAQVARDLAFPIYGINATSLRQALTTERLQGRVSATMRCVGWGTAPVGALVGGLLGERLGLWPTVALMALGGLLPPLWLLASPLRTMRRLPEPPVVSTPVGP